MTFQPRVGLAGYKSTSGNTGADAEPQPCLITQAGLFPLGDRLPASAYYPGSGAFRALGENAVIVVGGVAYAATRQGIYSLSGSTWTLVGALSAPANQAVGAGFISGIHYTINGSGDPILFGCYATINNQNRNLVGYTFNLNTSVVTETPNVITTVQNISPAASAEIVTEGTLYMLTGPSEVMTFNPNAAGLTSFIVSSALGNPTGGGSFVNHLSRQFLVNNTDPAFNQPTLYEFNGSGYDALLRIQQLPGNTLGAVGGESFHGLLPDGNNLILFGVNQASNNQGTAANGTVIFAREITFASDQAAPVLGADLTNVILPASLRGRQLSQNSRVLGVKCWADVDAVTGTLRRYVTVYRGGFFDAGNTRLLGQSTTYEYTDNATLLEAVSNESIDYVSWPVGSQLGGGERVFRADRPGVTYNGLAGIQGAETLSYVPVGGQTGQIVEVLIDPTNRGGPATQLATILAHTGGGTVNGNGTQVDGVDCNGVQRTITIAASSTNFGQGDTINYQLRFRGN